MATALRELGLLSPSLCNNLLDGVYIHHTSQPSRLAHKLIQQSSPMFFHQTHIRWYFSWPHKTLLHAIDTHVLADKTLPATQITKLVLLLLPPCFLREATQYRNWGSLLLGNEHESPARESALLTIRLLKHVR